MDGPGGQRQGYQQAAAALEAMTSSLGHGQTPAALDDVMRQAPRRLLAASLRDNRRGAELAEVLARAGEWRPHGALPDVPPGQASARVPERLRGEGWKAAADGAMISELGEAIAQRKVRILATRSDEAPSVDWPTFSGQVGVFPMPMAAYLEPVHHAAAKGWLSGDTSTFKREPRAAAMRADGLPRLAGHWRAHDAGERMLVYGINGPAPTLRVEGDKLKEALVLGPKGRSTSVRGLTPWEAWPHGGSDQDWDDDDASLGDPEKVVWALELIPLGAAQAALSAAPAQPELLAAKAVVCRRPEDDQRRKEMDAWLRLLLERVVAERRRGPALGRSRRGGAFGGDDDKS